MDYSGRANCLEVSCCSYRRYTQWRYVEHIKTRPNLFKTDLLIWARVPVYLRYGARFDAASQTHSTASPQKKQFVVGRRCIGNVRCRVCHIAWTQAIVLRCFRTHAAK
jgi:hypothetical protein